MRSVSARPQVMAFRGVSDLTAEQPRRRRINPPDYADVVAVKSDEDWLAEFADEKDAGARAKPAALPDLPLVDAGRLPVASQPVDLARPVEEIPLWIRQALFHWRFGPWRSIAFGIGVVLAAAALVFGMRYLGREARVPAEISHASASSELASAIATPIATPGPSPVLPALPAAGAPPSTAEFTTPDASLPTVTPAPQKSTTAKPAPASQRTRTPPSRLTTPASRSSARVPDRPSTSVARADSRTSGVRTTPTSTPAPGSSVKPTPTPAPISAPARTPVPTPTVLTAPAAAAARIDNTAAASSVPPPPPIAPVRPSEEAMVRTVLDHYRQAYASLNANAVAGVWPSVNVDSLSRAFGQLESQRFEFTDCRIEVSGGRAQATCLGKASYVPKVGARTTRTANREWAFILEKVNDGWIIRRADTR